MTVERLRPYSVNVFAAMSALAAEVGAVNLGQGFPDEDGPTAMLETARRAISDGVNQYPPGPGIAALRHAIAAQRARRYRVDFDPDSEVLVTVGASEAIAAAVLGLVEPGSEVLLIEPFFDTYSPVIAMAGSRAATAVIRCMTAGALPLLPPSKICRAAGSAGRPTIRQHAFV
jgi:N-succinyldiaminopimelate aminotransferase